MRPVYVTGHRNPDTDSIASAIAYAELRGRLDPETEYVPVRLGEVNAQTRWVLERAEVPEPRLLPHILLRVRDVMQESFHRADVDESVRDVGLLMAREGLDLLPIVDHDGALAGVMTERVLARRYIRESREASTLTNAPTAMNEIVEALEGEVLTGADHTVAGRVWVFALDAGSPSGISEGDVVVVGDREDAQRAAIDRGVDLLVCSNGIRPSDEIVKLAEERGAAVVVSPLDSYVAGRMVTLASPCKALMDAEPLTVRPDDLVGDVAELVKDVHYRAAVAIDQARCPIGLVARADLVRPAPRRVILIDHAEQGQSVPGVEEAEIVEILDHHHIGSIETHLPIRATFDPVGSTATLIVERFRQNGMEPSRPAATVLLGAVLSDTVILNSPTTTPRDRDVVEYLKRYLSLSPEEFGREMFEAGSDVSDASADDIVSRDAKEYEVGNATISIAQIETVGGALDDRRDELLDALRGTAKRNGHALAALMVTDIVERGTTLLVGGDLAPVKRAFDKDVDGGVVHLPGVMSRKKQVAPVLLGAL
jgi:manganese-dependent inorganic pyrophosphatase